MKELTSKLECLQTKGDFSEFMSLLIADLRTNRQDWENRDLESYLNAIMNWTEDMDGYYQNNNNLPTPSQCRLADTCKYFISGNNVWLILKRATPNGSFSFGDYANNSKSFRP